MNAKTLIFIPTYNEATNAPLMCEEIAKLGLDADLLFVDDSSPDGTGRLLEELKPRFPRLLVNHRPGKLGIGSAHFDAIEWAYEQGYQRLVTMDCDFTHSPADISKMLAALENVDLVVGSRWMNKESLPGWNALRLALTRLGRFLTREILGIPQDASGAFRVYNLETIPRSLFHLVQSKGYSFFFESLFIFNRNGFRIREVSIILPARTYGHSKMSAQAALKSGRYVFELLFASIRQPELFLLPGLSPNLDKDLVDPQDWDSYWSNPAVQKKGGSGHGLYDIIAGLYRRWIIRRNLEVALNRSFPAGAKLLHAGCGSGQVDVGLHERFKVTGLDISPMALQLYSRNNRRAEEVRHASIFQLPHPDASFDGIYNLGVMEHFTEEEIARILLEFRRVLKPEGKLVLFWPHARASSVFVLGLAHYILNRLLKQKTQFHPPEITHCRGQGSMKTLLGSGGFALSDYQFGFSDFFVQAVVVAQKA